MTLDRRILRALKAEYSAPRDPGYWTGLEAKIMGRVTNNEDEWSWAFRTWGRTWLAAAAVALIALGVTAWRERVTEREIAYDTVVESRPSLPVQLRQRLVDGSQHDATLRYVYGY
jgi:CHASE2 domain-containing sensor protein